MKSLYTPDQMTSWLSNYLERIGYRTEVYSDLFLPARVPIYARKELNESADGSIEEIVIDVINSRTIKSTDFFYDLTVSRTLAENGLEMEIIDASSATFFKYYFPRAKVYWAYPDYLIKDHQFSEFVELCQKYEIGLVEVGQGKGNNEEKVRFSSVSPTPLIESLYRRIQVAISPIRKHSGKAKKETKLTEEVKGKLYKELDRHIEETNRYLVYYPEPEYKRREIAERPEGRTISVTLIDKMPEVGNLVYKKYLQDLGGKYRRRIENDYDIALDLTKRLWKFYGLEYPEFQRGFEPVLLLNPRYRDHFLHQLHVFLTGCFIIDKMYKDRAVSAFEQKFGNRIEDMWLLASTYHDYNYNIQNYNDWIATFFRNTLFLDENPSRLRLDECYVKEGYMFKTKELCDAFNLGVDRTTLLFFYEKIINEKNHGLLGALSLLKLIASKRPRKIKKASLMNAAKAIALHDEEIWKHFSGRVDSQADLDEPLKKLLSDFSKKKLLENLKFKDDPLSFLLIFCDTIQEWGRVGHNYEEMAARLDDIEVSDDLVWVNLSVSHEKAFNQKKDEIDRVKKFLLDKRFKITLRTREGLGSITVNRYMDGK